jgi:dTDP-4-dehydrorhamnose 3,5-epimerase-like enzyme
MRNGLERPEIGIDWQLSENGITEPLLSGKDANNLSLREYLQKVTT